MARRHGSNDENVVRIFKGQEPHISKDIFTIIFGSIFALIGIGIAIAALVGLFDDGDSGGAGIATFMGFLFGGVGLFIIWKSFSSLQHTLEMKKRFALLQERGLTYAGIITKIIPHRSYANEVGKFEVTIEVDDLYCTVTTQYVEFPQRFEGCCLITVLPENYDINYVERYNYDRDAVDYPLPEIHQ
jgi:hypothetical protein